MSAQTGSAVCLSICRPMLPVAPSRAEPSQLAAACARIPTLVIVDRGDVPQAVSALKAGGLVILERPVTRADLLAGIRRAGSDEGLRT